nr:hypothetical protein [Tanacetum cinerariifolium]
ASVVDTLDLQTELERMKERFENCIIKKETVYAKLWNDWISTDKVSREAKKVPNTVSARSRTKLITVSQPSVITKKDMNSNLNCLSSIGLDNTKTRRPQPRSNTKNDRVPSVSKSCRSKNKEAKVKEHHRNLLLSKKNKHISSACNNFKIDSQDVISKVVYVVCKKCLNSVNHDVCLNNYVNGKNLVVGNIRQTFQTMKRNRKISQKLRSQRRLFDQDGKLVASSNSESHVDCSNGDNACTSNAMEPKIKRFPNSTFLLGRKFMGTIRFGNDHVAAILGFGDL